MLQGENELDEHALLVLDVVLTTFELLEQDFRRDQVLLLYLERLQVVWVLLLLSRSCEVASEEVLHIVLSVLVALDLLLEHVDLLLDLIRDVPLQHVLQLDRVFTFILAPSFVVFGFLAHQGFKLFHLDLLDD